MKVVRFVSGVSLFFAAACGAPHDPASADEHAGHTTAPPPTGNPVQREMQLLTTALESAVRGIGNRDVRGVEHALHEVHGAKEATAKAIADGSYRPPNNPDALDRFGELDEAFHGELRKLVEASRANDISATAEALGTVMQRCEGCHAEFRP